MRFLVSGGAGFIGSHLCEALLEANHQVVCVDNFLTGSPANVEHLHGRPGFVLLEHDLIHPTPEIEGDPPGAVLHFASPASPVGYRTHAIETLLVNSVGTINLLRRAQQWGARFLIASTSEVYGDPLVHPQPESYWGNVNPNGERACYDESKRFGEAATMEWSRQYGLDVRIIRIFNTYGPRNQLDDGRVVPNFITQALQDAPITIYGDGTQTRSFQYVADLVRAVLRFILRDDLKGEVINIGNPGEFTIGEFAQLVKEKTGSRSEIVYEPQPRLDDPARRKPDISRAQRLLDWEPEISLEQGLELTIPYFREALLRR